MESKGGIAAASATPRPSEPASALSERPLGATIATAVGLLLALAGTFAAPEGRPAGAVTRLVTVGLPNWLVVTAIASVALASCMVIAMALPRTRRRRKKGEEDYEMYHEPRRIPPLLGIGLMLLALAPAAALIGMLFWFGQESAGSSHGQGAIVAQHGGLAPATAGASAAPSLELAPASPITTGLAVAIAVLVAFAALSFVAWLAFGDRWLRRQPLEDRYRTAVAQAVDASLDDLEAELDARVAIQKIYRNFERLLAAAGLPRRPWQTPAEFTRSALAKSPLPTTLVQELTRLFEIARFSVHSLGADERDLAWRLLTSIRSTLDAAHRRPDGEAA